ncbi:O-antigen ligase family protein [Candidatus Falkowbacteria bacterium]|nr:O-antigen ligase family protein [Candidatus Falkowbacteria bacterium]
MVSRFIERRQQADWDLEAAILQAVAYFSLFKYPLSQWEVWSFLPHKAEILVVRQLLEQLVANGKLVKKWGYYFLPGQEAAVECRQQRYPAAIRKLKLAQRVANWLRWLPGVQFVALANLMGAYNLRAGGDIDLFIITRPGCLWVCRFWAALGLQLLGLRPTPENRRDKICLSFWLSSNNLRIDRFKLPDEAGCPDWYYIYWLANLRPLVEQGVSYQKIIKQNPWLKTYLPNWRPGDYQLIVSPVIKRLALVASRMAAWLAGPWEKTMAYWQQRFLPETVKSLMNKDQRVVVNDQVIKLHTVDRRRHFRDRLLVALEQLKKGQTDSIKADPLDYFIGSGWLIKISQWLSLALCLVLPWSTRWIIKSGNLGGVFWEYGTISLYVSDILLILALLAIYLSKSKKNQLSGQVDKYFGYWLLGFWLISGFSFLVNRLSFNLVFFNLFRLIIWSAGWWLLVAWQDWPLRRWISYVLIGLVGPAILGVVQFISQGASANKWLGLAEHQPGDLGVAVIEATNSWGQVTGRWLRAYGSFDQPNILGAVMAIAILLAMVSWQRASSNLARGFLAIGLGLWSLAMLTSWSRAAWLAVFIGWLTAVGLAWFSKKFHFKYLIVFLISLVIWLGLWSWPFHDLGYSRLTGQARLEQKSLDERQAGYQQVWPIIKHNPAGVGLGNYTGFLSQQSENIGPAWLYQPVHNSLVLILAEIGWLGFGWLLVGAMILLVLVRKYCELVWPLAAAVFWLMLLDHWWWSLHSGLVWFWFLVAILLKIGRRRPNLL